MKLTITLVVALILIALIILGIRIASQNRQISKIEKATIAEPTPVTTETVSDNTTTITKTASGISQTGDVLIDDENTYLKFTGFGPGKEHEGTFDTMTADISFVDGAVNGGKLVIEASSINTGIEGLDSHLKTDDFLDIETNPQIEFTLIDVVTNDEDQSATVNGELTMKGVTKNISAPLTLLANGFSVDFLIDMSIFGISYTGVNDQVQIEAQVIWN